MGRRLDVPHNVKMSSIKFVPTSEWRVSLCTEECAERTWERDSGIPLVSAAMTAAAMSAAAGTSAATGTHTAAAAV